MAFRGKCFQFSRSSAQPSNPIRQYFTLCHVFVLACSNSDYDFMMSTLCCTLTSLVSLWFTTFVVFTVYTPPCRCPSVWCDTLLAAPAWVCGDPSPSLVPARPVQDWCSYGGAGYLLARRPHQPLMTHSPLFLCHWPTVTVCQTIFALILRDVDLNFFLCI